MYDAAVDKNNLFCLCQQTNVRRDELYEQPVLGAQERRAVVAPPATTAHATLFAINWHSRCQICYSLRLSSFLHEYVLD